MLALAQLTILLFTPIEALLVPVLHRPDAPYCDGFNAMSMLCVGQGLGGVAVWRWVMIAVLIVVLVGIFPRWTALPHFWVSFTLCQSISLPDGGESVAQIITLLLVPLLWLDDRKWHWKWPERPASPTKKGVSLAILLFVRLQLAAIYIHGGLSKLGTDAWLNGSAEFYIAQSSNFGVSGPIEPIFLWFVSLPVGTALISWGTIILETALGVMCLGTARMRMVALVLGSFLHIAIILTIGLWSFSLIMIGTLIVATSLNRDQSARVLRSIRSRRLRSKPAPAL